MMNTEKLWQLLDKHQDVFDIVASRTYTLMVNSVILLVFSFLLMKSIHLTNNENWQLLLSSLTIGSMCTLVLYWCYEAFSIPVKLITHLKQRKKQDDSIPGNIS
jgi:hypothetical protein